MLFRALRRIVSFSALASVWRAAKPMMARKLRFADAYSRFHAWIGPLGYMVRLEQDGSGLRVEREPSPAVKRPARPTPR